MPLSRHSLGTYQETSLHATRRGTLSHSRLSSLSHCGLILVYRVESVCASESSLIFFFFKAQTVEPSPKVLASEEKATTAVATTASSSESEDDDEEDSSITSIFSLSRLSEDKISRDLDHK